jgi:hypothetical protein
MGWGTFIAGRVLRQPRAKTNWADELSEAQKILAKRQVVFESEVLNEINRLKAEGKEVDINIVKADMRKLRKAYKGLGPTLEIQVLRKAQQKTIAGEEVNYAQIEREILDAYKPFPWGKAMKWLFLPHFPLGKMILKRIQRNKEGKDS